jgi:predicted nicotinamide N-methyase
MRILELGAGAALAGIVLLQLLKSVNCSLIVQEIDEQAVNYSLACIESNTMNCGSNVIGIPALWGIDCIQKVNQVTTQSKSNIVIMADVFYHEEHFEDLLLTIDSLLEEKGSLIVSVEQRRKNLLPIIQKIFAMFEEFTIHQYSIQTNPIAEEHSDSLLSITNIFVFTCCNKLTK